MLKAKLQHFYELVESARDDVGESAPKIADKVIKTAFPRTMAEADIEGCEGMLRTGVIQAVTRYIRKLRTDARQRTFNDIAPDVMPFVEKLASASYYVPGDAEYVGLPDLCFDLERLDQARRYMRQKGLEVLSEATRLDELYEYLASRRRS